MATLAEGGDPTAGVDADDFRKNEYAHRREVIYFVNDAATCLARACQVWDGAMARIFSRQESRLAGLDTKEVKVERTASTESSHTAPTPLRSTKEPVHVREGANTGVE